MKRIIPVFLLPIILILSFSAIKAVAPLDNQGSPSETDKAQSCTIEIDSNKAAAWGGAVENIVSLGLIHGTKLASDRFTWIYEPADPSGNPGYWYIKLSLDAGWVVMWQQGVWMSDIVFTNCPNPTEPDA